MEASAAHTVCSAGIPSRIAIGITQPLLVVVRIASVVSLKAPECLRGETYIDGSTGLAQLLLVCIVSRNYDLVDKSTDAAACRCQHRDYVEHEALLLRITV